MRKKKLELNSTMDLSYTTIADLIILKHAIEEGLKNERKSGHVEAYSIYENLIKALEHRLFEEGVK